MPIFRYSVLRLGRNHPDRIERRLFDPISYLISCAKVSPPPPLAIGCLATQCKYLGFVRSLHRHISDSTSHTHEGCPFPLAVMDGLSGRMSPSRP
jgi:hypothetical protein